MITEEEVDRLFKEGFDCSQIVLAAVSDKLGITREHAYAVASCFGIGMAQGETCGAATGAMMAIGIRYGNVKTGDLKTKFEVFAKRDEFIRRFAEMNGKVRCPDLLGRRVDSFDELMLLGATTDVFKNCPKYCVNAVKILEEML
jgi:C_GCAxxG_C_C family probable redox protein